MITRIGLAVVLSCSLLGTLGAPDAASAAASCGPGTSVTAHADLPRPLRIVDGPLVGNRTLWTIPPRVPKYGSTTKSWGFGKQAWFRLEKGPLTVTGRRVDGGTGDFQFDMPPVESYPLWLNAGIGPGFIPSSYEFSTGGCWKVTARLGRSRVVLFFDIDDSKAAICAEIASALRAVRASSEPWAKDQVDTIAADQQARRCPV